MNVIVYSLYHICLTGHIKSMLLMTLRERRVVLVSVCERGWTMYQPAGDTQEVLEATADIVDAKKKCWPEHAEKRRESRRSLRTKCDLGLFKGPEAETATLGAVAQNQAFRGLSVQFDGDGPVTTGRPVEVVVNMPGGKRTYLAGIVVFCREVDGAGYELGIDVKASGACSILTHDVKRAKTLYDWFATAVKVPD